MLTFKPGSLGVKFFFLDAALLNYFFLGGGGGGCSVAVNAPRWLQYPPCVYNSIK